MKHLHLGMAAVFVLLMTLPAQAKSEYQPDFTDAYPAADGSRIDTCQICHVNSNPSSGKCKE